MIPMNWLMKEEPTHYSFDDLVRDKKTSWTGVQERARAEASARHPEGRSHLFLPHGRREGGRRNREGGGAGVRRSGDAAGKLYAVDVVPVKKLKSPVTLAAVKADKAFASFPLVRMSRLSVMPVTDDEWERIERMGS